MQPRQRRAAYGVDSRRIVGIEILVYGRLMPFTEVVYRNEVSKRPSEIFFQTAFFYWFFDGESDNKILNLQINGSILR